MKKTLTVAAIQNGTVIDHIPSGQALRIIALLQLSHHPHAVYVGLHLRSTSMGVKDLIKIENLSLSEREAQDIAVFAPQATISIISSYQVQNKMKATLPDIVRRVLICPNAMCTTRVEPVDTFFYVKECRDKIHLQCKYCEKMYERDQVRDFCL